MSVESRPAIYLPNLTPEELISYAQQYAHTALEQALLCRLVETRDSLYPVSKHDIRTRFTVTS